MSITFVNAAETRERVGMPTAVDAVREAFRDYAAGRFISPVRTAFGNGQVLVMPVYHIPSASAAVKTLQVRLDRTPAITGVIVWTDAEGEVVMDASEITAIRTGAAAGVATDLLAPVDSRRMVMIGAGAQAFDQVAAVLAVRNLEHLTVISRTGSSAERLAEAVRKTWPGLGVDTASDPGPALRRADIVSCATSSSTPVFNASDLPERVHVNGIGSYTPSMREIPQEALLGARVVVDSLEAALKEAGELIGAVGAGVLDPQSIQELGTALDTPAGGTRTVFKSVGLALQDWALAGLVARSVRTPEAAAPPG
ncbi:ornithine cyclodeaminase family protein [Arthrobacter sp. GCM10027362]|uniref:ornithine cyclodeaminase family protein n=1 Tax=Arthrobacter sp. GCM10027362 TaxID=3273379 RepID=UPI00364568D7